MTRNNTRKAPVPGFRGRMGFFMWTHANSGRYWKLLTPLCGCMFLALTSCERTARVMSWHEYASRSYSWPYLVNIYSTHGALFYFGAKHSTDPTNPQFSEIEDFWNQFRPDIAFNEGGNPPVELTRDEAIKKYGEPGLVRYLSARDKVTVKSIDPTWTEEVAALRKSFSPEQLKLYFILRQMTEYGRTIQPPDSWEQELQITFQVLKPIPGQDVEPRSASELESAFARYFPGLGSYKDSKPSWFDPVVTGKETVFNRISRSSSDFRDKYMAVLITREVCEGKRVFAVVGGSHVVTQEPAIRITLLKSCPK